MAIPPDRPLKGFKLCPVCGCRYQGSLDAHLNAPIRDSDGISRCDWRLGEARIFRVVQKLGEEGWKLAGQAAARTAVLLGKTHPHLAMQTTSGSIATKVHRMFLDPKNDLKAWWIRRWAFPLAQVPGWSLRHRAQVVIELDGCAEAGEVVEAAFRIGGIDAVKELEGGLIPKRCDEVYGDPVDAVISRGHTRLFDRCILAKGHGEEMPHRGAKTNIMWGPGYVADSGMSDIQTVAEPEEAELDLEALFRPGMRDDW